LKYRKKHDISGLKEKIEMRNGRNG